MWRGRRVLVTGGSGFIGGHLIQALEKLGANPSNLDWAAPRNAAGRQYWHDVDMRDGAAVRDAIHRFNPELIYNLAASTDISLGETGLAVNTDGLVNLLASVDEASATRIVHISTQLVMKPGHMPAHELDFAPYTQYGESKADSERVLRSQHSFKRWTILRPTNVWGPWHPTFASQIWRYIDKGWYLHPSGHDPLRSYGYVANVVSQFIRVGELDSNAADGKTYYVGDEPMRSSVWVDCFSYALRGKRARRVPASALNAAAWGGEALTRAGLRSPIDRGRFYRMTTDYAVPMQESLSILGRGTVSLEEGVDRTVAWLKQHRTS